MKPDPIFVWTSPGKPTLTRDLATTDTYLRMALGDTAATTGKLMELANGWRASLKVTYRGVVLEVRRLQVATCADCKGSGMCPEADRTGMPGYDDCPTCHGKP